MVESLPTVTGGLPVYVYLRPLSTPIRTVGVERASAGRNRVADRPSSKLAGTGARTPSIRQSIWMLASCDEPPAALTSLISSGIHADCSWAASGALYAAASSVDAAMRIPEIEACTAVLIAWSVGQPAI